LTALCIDGWRQLLGAVSAGKEVSVMRTYKVRVLVPSIMLVEANDEKDAVKKVAQVYTGYYTHDFDDWIEPLLQPEDVT
jgi:hypothetical protein